MTGRRFEWDDEPVNGGSRPAAPAAGGGADGGAYVRDLWNFLRRNYLVIVLTPLVVLGVALLATRYIRPVYESDTTIRIDEERSAVPILDVLATLGSGGSGIGTEMQVLRSRTLAEAVIDSLRLQVRLRTPRSERDALVRVVRVDREAPRARYEVRNDGSGRFEVRRRGGEVLVRAGVGEAIRVPGVVFELQPAASGIERLELGVERYEDVLRATRRQIVVGRPARDADIVQVNYSDTDRALAAAVPNVLAERFITFRNRDRTVESESTVRFLDTQLGQISSQLRNAESELLRFREGSGLVSLEAEATASIAGLGELKAQRDALAAEATALRDVVAQLAAGSAQRGTDRRVFAFPTLLRVPAASQLLTSLAELEDERARRLQIRMPEDAEIVALDTRIREIEQQIVDLAATYMNGLNAQVASLDRTLGQHRGELQRVPAQEIAYARLLREVQGLEEIYTVLHTTLKEQEVLAAVEDVSVRVVDPAPLPTRPVRPNLPLTAGLALLVGGVLGVGAAFVREQVDTAVHSREDLQRAAHGVPLLATVPHIRAPAGARANGRGRLAKGGRPVSWLAAAHDPQSPVAEAYRSLRTSIAFSRPGAPPKTLVFTSPLPGDGKSTTASNLAVTLARQGARCVLVDADMRRGALHALFGAAREPGLSNVLLGRVPAAEAIRTVQAGDVEIALLPAGVAPPNPAELVGSERMAELIAELAASYDAVIVDAPPLNLVTDAALIGVHADGVVLVARSAVTDRGAVAYAVEQLRGVRARVLGSVLNDSGDGRDRYYGSYVPDADEVAAR